MAGGPGGGATDSPRITQGDELDEVSYYPSCKVRLIIRFDEMSRRVFSGPANPVPKRPTNKLSGTKDIRAPLRVVSDDAAPPGVRRFILQPTGGGRALFGTLGPEKQVASKDGLTHSIEGIIPRSANWAQNGIRSADTLNLTLRYIDCPIDPRTVRSVAVEFFLGCVTADQFQSGMNGNERGGVSTKNAEAMQLVPDTFRDANGIVRSNRRFIGWVDKWVDDWTSEDEPLIQLECRDNTQLLIDQEAPAKLVIAGSRLTAPVQVYGENGQVTSTVGSGAGVPLDYAIAQYLSHFPQFQGLTVEYRPNGEAPPSIDGALARTAFRPQLGPPPSLALGANSGLSVWDYMTDVCGALGLLVRVDDTTVIIQRARSIYTDDTKPVQRADDPFKPRFSGQRYRRMLYGRNIKDLKITRSLTRSAPVNIEARCYLPEKKTDIVAHYPSRINGKGIQSSVPGDGGAEEKWLVWRVSGISDTATLRIVAQTVYEMLGRAELTVRVTTRNLASLGGGNSDPDLLDMRAGDTFEVRTASAEDSEEAASAQRVDVMLRARQQGEAFMRSLGFDAELAKTYSAVYNDMGFQNIFKSRTIGTSWDVDDGVAIEIEGINYIEVRADPIKAGIIAQEDRQK